MVVAQYNASTDKVIYDSATDKVQVAVFEYNCTGCASGSELPLVFECVISGFTPPDDGCCNDFVIWASVDFVNLPSLDGSHLLPVLSSALCRHAFAFPVSEYEILAWSGEDCSIEIIDDFTDNTVTLTLQLTSIEAIFNAVLPDRSIPYFRARKTYVDMGYAGCAAFAQGILDGDVISLTTQPNSEDCFSELGGSVTIAKGN